MWLTQTMPARSAFTARKALKMSRVQTAAAKPVGRIVGDLHRVFFVFERNHRGDWAEDFFAGDAGAVVDVVEDGRLDVVALGELLGASAADSDLGFFLADLHDRSARGRIDLC